MEQFDNNFGLISSKSCGTGTYGAIFILFYFFDYHKILLVNFYTFKALFVRHKIIF
jgi:hypothetical protein